jgi:hypothetical protein
VLKCFLSLNLTYNYTNRKSPETLTIRKNGFFKFQLDEHEEFYLSMTSLLLILIQNVNLLIVADMLCQVLERINAKQLTSHLRIFCDFLVHEFREIQSSGCILFLQKIRVLLIANISY